MDKILLDLTDGRSYPVTLGQVINDGGEGRIHSILELDDYCAKIYRQLEGRKLLEERLVELSEFGCDGWDIGEHPELAYPVGVCRNKAGKCVGFAMKKLKWPHTALTRTLQPASAVRTRGLLTWEYCIAFAADLARVVDKLHTRGVVAGDLCPDNIYVSLLDARITLIDVDSFQFTSRWGDCYTSDVMRPDYSAPELVTAPPGSWRDYSADLTALGIVIAQILLDGYHPFGGYPKVITGEAGDDLEVRCIADGLSWVTSPRLVYAPNLAPDAARILPPRVIGLMRRCFADGAQYPGRRPRASEWIEELAHLADSLQTCGQNEHHRFRGGPRRCPWCDRAQKIDRDPFPPPIVRPPLPSTWLILSKKRAQYERAWDRIEKIKEEDGVVTGTVIEVVEGGLILDIGLRGFLPASLVEMRRVSDLQPYVGRELEAKIIELDQPHAVLSRRAWLEQTQSEVRQNLLNTLRKGQIRKGVVSSIVQFGAFVDLGGMDGLVHVSKLSWKHIDHPGEVVEVGQEVTVEVLDVDMDRERVSLSLKSTQEDPWQQFARTHQIGQVVPGRVTKLVPFGAFVRVEEGIEGLVHISELADRHVEIPEQVVQVGDEIFVKIIDIDLDRRRISLSLKQANEGTIGEAVGDDFDPTLYGMPAEYDDQGNYVYPEGWDLGTEEWLEGCDTQREEWEQQYAEARARFEAHCRQVAEARQARGGSGAVGKAESGDQRMSRRQRRSAGRGRSGSDDAPRDPFASDEALAALRDKLPGGQRLTNSQSRAVRAAPSACRRP